MLVGLTGAVGPVARSKGFRGKVQRPREKTPGPGLPQQGPPQGLPRQPPSALTAQDLLGLPDGARLAFDGDTQGTLGQEAAAMGVSTRDPSEGHLHFNQQLWKQEWW